MFNNKLSTVRIIVIIVFITLIVRLIWVQIIEGPKLKKEGLSLRVVTEIQPAKRGNILTKDGIMLASTDRRWLLQANQREIANYKQRDNNGKIIARGGEAVAKNIYKLIGKSLKETEQLLIGEKVYSPLADNVNDLTWDKIKKFKIPGIFETPYYVRTYPANVLAGNIIGYPFKVQGIKGLKDDDNIHFHYAGVDGYENKLLAGIDGEQKIEVAGNGDFIPGGYEKGISKKDGCSITLTLDSNIQYKAQQVINEQVKKAGAKSGSLVMLDVKTGKIVAMADSGSINPNNFTKVESSQRGAKAVSNVFEPGSTGKVLTMAEVLQEKLHTPTSKLSVPSTLNIRGEEYKDHDPHGVTPWTLNGVLTVSSNIGTLMAGKGLTSKTRYKYMKKFGFGTQTGIEMPSEASGILHKPGTDAWDNRTRETVLFGQGVSVNALQAVSVYQTIANKGVRIPPRLVDGYKCSEKKYIKKAPPKSKKVISGQNAKKLVKMLESVVESGTGRSAQLKNYLIAGKTGTSELIKANGKTYLASFIGIAPADKPKYVLGVFIDSPTAGIYGSISASPAFQKLMQFTLETKNVLPSIKKPKLYPTTW